jgi:Chs5-Arf1p-binding protein BUD7/BCH1
VNERGERQEATEELWLETYLSAILRAYAYADDITNDVVGTRRFNPIASTEAEHRFFEAAEKLFFKGWLLGSDTETQVPNLVANHLADGILNYIHTTGRYASGVNLFEKLRTKDPEIASLLARVMIDGDDEVRAVRVTCDTIRLLPMDFATLDVQTAFLISKKDWELALPIAEREICAAPSEFKAWARLAETYLAMERYEDVSVISS